MVERSPDPVGKPSQRPNWSVCDASWRWSQRSATLRKAAAYFARESP